MLRPSHLVAAQVCHQALVPHHQQHHLLTATRAATALAYELPQMGIDKIALPSLRASICASDISMSISPLFIHLLLFSILLYLESEPLSHLASPSSP